MSDSTVGEERWGALAHPAFIWILIGALVSNVGTTIESVVIGVYVTKLTGLAVWTGGVIAIAYLPSIFLGPIGGTLADRFDRRRFLIAVVLLQTLAAGSLALLAWRGPLAVPAVAALMFVAGCASAFGDPAFVALLADLVPSRLMLSVTTLVSAQFNVARVAGPALAVLLAGLGGPALALTVNAVSFAAVLLPVCIIPIRRRKQETKRQSASIWNGLREGFRIAAADVGIRTALLVILGMGFFVSPFLGLIPAFALKALGGDTATTALLVSTQGLSAALSAVGTNALAKRIGRRRVLQGAMLVVGPLAALYWLSSRVGLAVICIAPLAVVLLALSSSCSTILLSRVPDEMRARIASIFVLTLGSAYAAGLVSLGWLGDRIGLHLAGAIAGLTFAALAIGARLVRPGLLDFLDSPAPRPSE